MGPWLVWTCAEYLSPPEFDPRTVQPAESSYTDEAEMCVELQDLCCHKDVSDDFRLLRCYVMSYGM